MLEHLGQCAFQGSNETGRLNVDLLGFTHLLSKVLHLHDVELRNEWINDLSLIVDCASVFEF